MKLVIRLARIEEIDGKNRQIVKGAEFFLDSDKDLHTDLGIIRKEELAKGTFEKHSTTYHVVPATFSDKLSYLPRKAQIITSKDASYIFAEAGLHKESEVIEAGTGSGGLTCFLAKRIKHVYSYDLREDHQSIAKKNAEFLGLENISFIQDDVINATNEVDAIILDLPNPQEVLEKASSLVRLGGRIIVYTPTISQVMVVSNSLPKSLQQVKVVELIERKWKVKDKAVRPVSEGLGHTAFLTVLRRLV